MVDHKTLSTLCTLEFGSVHPCIPNCADFLLQLVTPWDVKGGSDGKIDYAKLSRDVRLLDCVHDS